jgi:hypothetical protein
MIPPLFAHQTESIEFFRGKPATFDASDPGTGKTRVGIEVFRARLLNDPRAVLILAPKSLLKAAWSSDIRKYAPELMISVAYAENREKAFAAPADVYITNHDAAKWLVKQPKSFFKRFSTLIVDECGAFKHPTSQRSKALEKISQHFEFRHGMNGTVAPNSIVEMHHQYKILDGGKRLGKSWFGFRSAVCQPQQNGPQPNMVKWIDRPGAEVAAADLVKDMTMRHVFEDCIDIPPNHTYCVPFVLKPAHMKHYKTMQTAEILALKDGTVTAINAAAVSTKLAQIASGAVYESSELYHKLDNDRYELVMDLVEQAKHSLVFFIWQHQKEELIAAAEAREFTYAVIDGTATSTERDEAVRLFESGFYKVLFMHPQSAAHGLTLVKATRTIWASPTFNLEHFMQGNKRFHRAGQTQKTETIVVIAEGTIDERIYKALLDKRVRQDSLLEELMMKEAA